VSNPKIRLPLAVGAAAAACVILAYRTAAARADAGVPLRRPPDLRELVFLSSNHGLSYGPAAHLSATPAFTNIFVEPAVYRSFMKTGTWPEGTTLFMEVRAGVDHGAIGAHGNSQGALLGVEAEHKDSTRYPDGGWAYFAFGVSGQTAQPLPRTADCYSCHRLHGAVEWTFTQFLPEQFAVAQRMGTVRRDYDPRRKLQ
jgi:Cytochrome P460